MTSLLHALLDISILLLCIASIWFVLFCAAIMVCNMWHDVRKEWHEDRKR